MILSHVAINCLRLGLLAQFLSDLLLRLNVFYHSFQYVVVTPDVRMLLKVFELDALSISALTISGVGA